MKLKMYSMFDSKTQSYGTPFFQRTRGEAERTFKTWANDETTNVGNYPEDFTLMEVGEFDDQTCILTCTPELVSIGNAQQFKAVEI